MMRPRPDPVDVLVAGFGPVGAALAGLLGKRGLKVLVLERDDQVFPLPRAAHVDHTRLRTWQGLDFLTAHGDLLARIPGDQSSTSGLPTSMYFFQPALDRTVREAVSAMPSVTVRLGAEVTGVTSAEDHVRVVAVTPDGERVSFGGIVFHDDAEIGQHQECRPPRAGGQQEKGTIVAMRKRLVAGAPHAEILPFAHRHLL